MFCLIKSYRLHVYILVMDGSGEEELTLEENEFVPSDLMLHLDSTAFNRYKPKLTLSGYSVPDPFGLPNQEWSDSVSGWPAVEYPCIFNYFVNTPGMYTPESLQAYKSLDSYALYHAGHVQTLWHHIVSDQSPVCILKSRVARSQSANEKPYDVWATLKKKDSSIMAAHCTCMAG